MPASPSSQSLANIGSAASGVGSGFQSITGALGDIFGTSESAEATERGTITEQLEIDEAGIQKILQDILGGTQGLGSIFSEEQVAGVFGSTVAAQGAGNLLANLAGEIAKLTAKKVQTKDITTSQAGGTGGLLENIF